MVRAARAIQKIIQVTKADGDDRQRAADQLLGLERQAARAERQRAPKPRLTATAIATPAQIAGGGAGDPS